MRRRAARATRAAHRRLQLRPAEEIRVPAAVQLVEDVTRLLPDDTWLTQFEMKSAARGKEARREIRLRGESANAGRLISLLEESKAVRAGGAAVADDEDPARPGRDFRPERAAEAAAAAAAGRAGEPAGREARARPRPLPLHRRRRRARGARTPSAATGQCAAGASAAPVKPAGTSPAGRSGACRRGAAENVAAPRRAAVPHRQCRLAPAVGGG